jgi:hypothetical protein
LRSGSQPRATGAASFLGCDIHASPVVYISEEAGGTLLHKLPDDGAHMHILTRDSGWPKPDWPQLVQLVPTRGGATLGPPKSSRSRRTVALDAATVAPLRDHLAAAKPRPQALHDGAHRGVPNELLDQFVVRSQRRHQHRS